VKKQFVLKIVFTITSVLVLGVISFYVFWHWYDQKELSKERQNTYTFLASEKEKLRDGDIILRQGFGMVSDYIVNYFDEKYKISHCGIVCKSGDSLYVIHSESSSYFAFEGIQTQNFDHYVAASKPQSVLVVRYNRCDSSELSKISKRGKHYLAQKIPFDYNFDIQDSEQMYCSEIIWHVFLDIFKTDIYQTQQKPANYSQFANFWDSTYFNIIINHQQK
jgi:uncharacterized protein YycO